MARWLPIGLLPLLVCAAGCGGGGASSNGEASKSANQVVADAQKAAQQAKGVHVFGSLSDAGKRLTLDLQLVADKGGKGTMSESNLAFDIIRVGDKAYIKGSDAFLRQFAGSGAQQLLHGKWLAGSATSGDLASLTTLTDLQKLVKGALGGSHGKLKNQGETTYKGQKVVAIKDTTEGGTLYIAATGDPFPVAITNSGSKSGAITFDHWNETVSIDAPKGAIDLSTLGKN